MTQMEIERDRETDGAADGTLCARKESKPFVGSSLRQFRQNKRRVATGMRNLRLLLTRNIINRKF